MPQECTELEKRNAFRLSNEQASRLSKECIQTALVHLMAEADIDEISISRIVKKAGVSRTVFYNNYKSKPDVLACVIAALMERQIQLTLEVITTEDRGKVFAGIFQVVREDPQQLEMLLKSGIDGSDFLNIRSFLSDQYPQLTGEIRFLLFGWGGMIRSILLDWFFQGMIEDEEEMGALCAKLSEDIMARIRAADPHFIETVAAFQH